jgi:hypothetical protein
MTHSGVLRNQLLAFALAASLLLVCTGLARAEGLPSNSDFGDQWALLNTGQFSGTPGDDIDIERAWELEPGGNAAVVLGLVDSGVDFEHPSLEHANLYTAEDGGCGGGGALYGCSFVAGSTTPNDEAGHGTATAGEILAGWNEGPFAGIAPATTLITAKVLDSTAKGSSAAEVSGIDYVAEHGARVVNVSIVGEQSAALHTAIASHPNTLFVAAAGNSGADDDGSSARYPCADPSPNVICVAASNPQDELASFSNYGAKTVDLAAPGTNIATLTLEGASDGYNGTSFAAPLVSGTAALAFALRPRATVAQVKQAILGSVDARAQLSGKTVTGGRLDSYGALQALRSMLPEAPPSSTGAPVLGPQRILGETLAADSGTWSGNPSSTTIAWERCDANGGHCQLIDGARGPEYELTSADVGDQIRAQVTATNAAGSEIAFSAAVTILATAPTATSASSRRTSQTSALTPTSGSRQSTQASKNAARRRTALRAYLRVIHTHVALLFSSSAVQQTSVRVTFRYAGEPRQSKVLLIGQGARRSLELRPAGGKRPRSVTVEIHSTGVSLKRVMHLT